MAPHVMVYHDHAACAADVSLQQHNLCGMSMAARYARLRNPGIGIPSRSINAPGISSTSTMFTVELL